MRTKAKNTYVDYILLLYSYKYLLNISSMIECKEFPIHGNILRWAFSDASLHVKRNTLVGIIHLVIQDYDSKWNNFKKKCIPLFILSVLKWCLSYPEGRYKYKFPFLTNNAAVSVDDNCVDPLYKHVFPPQVAPRLSFIGLPLKVCFYHYICSAPI